jgi:hypothetical protein
MTTQNITKSANRTALTGEEYDVIYGRIYAVTPAYQRSDARDALTICIQARDLGQQFRASYWALRAARLVMSNAEFADLLARLGMTERTWEGYYEAYEGVR